MTSPNIIPTYPGSTKEPKVVLLWSSLSSNHKQSAAQKLCNDQLIAKHVRFEQLDGAQDENKILRNKFFDISGIRKYPQIFIIDGSNIQPMGNETDLQDMIDYDSFAQFFGSCSNVAPPAKNKPQYTNTNKNTNKKQKKRKIKIPNAPKRGLPAYNKALPSVIKRKDKNTAVQKKSQVKQNVQSQVHQQSSQGGYGQQQQPMQSQSQYGQQQQVYGQQEYQQQQQPQYGQQAQYVHQQPSQQQMQYQPQEQYQQQPQAQYYQQQQQQPQYYQQQQQPQDFVPPPPPDSQTH